VTLALIAKTACGLSSDGRNLEDFTDYRLYYCLFFKLEFCVFQGVTYEYS
jgi:hypothetical protein